MFRIEIAASALADADAAYAWMAENISPAFAETWYRELFKQIDTLILLSEPLTEIDPQWCQLIT
jgi:hypothetical protein